MNNAALRFILIRGLLERFLYSDRKQAFLNDDVIIDQLLEWVHFGQNVTLHGGIPKNFHLIKGWSSPDKITTSLMIDIYPKLPSFPTSSNLINRFNKLITWAIQDFPSAGYFLSYIINGLVKAFKLTDNPYYRELALSCGTHLLNDLEKNDAQDYYSSTGGYRSVAALMCLNKISNNFDVDRLISFLEEPCWIEKPTKERGVSHIYNIISTFHLSSLLLAALDIQRDSSVHLFQSKIDTFMQQLLITAEVNQMVPAFVTNSGKKASDHINPAGSALFSIIMMRYFQHTKDLRFLNLAFKINESLRNYLLHFNCGHDQFACMPSKINKANKIISIDFYLSTNSYLIDALILEREISRKMGL